MADCSVTLQGQISIGPGNCGSCSGCGSTSVGPSMTTKPLKLACGPSSFRNSDSTPCSVEISTSGSAGQNFVDLPGARLPTVDLLYVTTNLPVILRVNADEARLDGVGASYPATFVGGETFNFTSDGVAVDTTFPAGSLTAQEVVNQINAAAAIAGLAFQPASVLDDGQVGVRTNVTGNGSALEVTAAQALIGFPNVGATANGAGEDLPINGVFLSEFSPPVTRLQVSGQARIEVLSAQR